MMDFMYFVVIFLCGAMFGVGLSFLIIGLLNISRKADDASYFVEKSYHTYDEKGKLK